MVKSYIRPGTALGSALNPEPIAGVERAIGIAAGWEHSLLIAPDGTVLAWGGNTYYQLGLTVGATRTPTTVPGVTDVVASLLSETQRDGFAADNRAAQQKLREQYATRGERATVTYQRARANRQRLDFAAPPTPAFTGARHVDVDLAELVPFIDWTFFFSAWELKGRYPAILEDPVHGEAARDLFAHGQKLLQRIVDGKLLRARGVYGFWPAGGDGDDVVLFTPDSRLPTPGRRELARFPMLRQQEVIADDKPNRSLADFVAPCDSNVQDYVGAFAVTTGLGADALVKRFEAAHDDYSAILVKAIADRLAEAFAEYLHARARADWGIHESLSNEELIAFQSR